MPNESANWIASANSASREPCLRCFGTSSSGSSSQCYIITSEGKGDVNRRSGGMAAVERVLWD